MASQSDYPEGWKSTGNRRVPHSLATGFFAKSKKGSGDVRSPTLQSPTLSMGAPRAPLDISVPGLSTTQETKDTKTEPITIPSQCLSQYSTQKQKKLAPNTFNTHYRSISRSMNDLGNIFSRGRSPPNRDDSPKRPSVGLATHESTRKRQQEGPQSASFESGSVPLISVMQHGEQGSRDNVAHEGWINVIDSHTLKKGPLKEAWKLHHAVVSESLLMLYKPPSSYQIRAFEIGAGPSAIPRPQSAPASASPSFSISSLRHKSVSRHPELVLGENGLVDNGTVEALCHELMFTPDTEFVEWAARSLSGWTGPETALSVLIELSVLKDASSRITDIIRILTEATPGLLLEEGCYNCARLLVEKGVGPYNTKLARTSRTLLETRRADLHAALQLTDSPDEPKTPGRNPFDQLSPALTADEFMGISPDLFAAQIHLYHLKYFQSWSPSTDISLLLVSPHLPPPSHRNPLVFNTSSLHFLGERVLNQVLCEDSTTSIERRSAILSQWIQVSQLLKLRGDMVGYLAITMAILSPPILRLRETWTNIGEQIVGDLEEKGGLAMRTLERRRLSYSGKLEDGLVFIPKGIGQDISSDDAVPYFGDLLHCMDEAYASRGRTIHYQKMVQGLQAIADSVRRWKREWPSTISQVRSDIKGIEQVQNCLESLNSKNQNPPSFNSTVYFDKSLACESSTTGMYLHSHYHQRLPLSTGANVPLIFTEIRTSFSLFDRYDTLAISGSLHKKAPSSGLAAPTSSSSPYTANIQQNQNLRPPTSHSHTQQPVLRRTRSFPPSKPSAQTTGYDELDFTTRERTAVLHGGDNAMLRAIRDVAGVGQQLFYSKDGELVLKSITDEAQSRPTSVIEIASKAQKASSRRYSEITSNGPSPRISMHGDQIPVSTLTQGGLHDELSPFLLVVPKGGTLERLVDILVLGVEDFSKRMNRSDRGPSPETTPLLKMDMDIFTITFFATFRSYCSPAVLIDYLKKRLVGSKSAATFSQNEGDDVVFPDWTGVDNLRDEDVDWNLVAKIHIGILDAIHIWISEFYMDFHCDQYLGESFISFLEIASKEISMWKSISSENHRLRKHADDINGLWKSIKEKFKKLAFTPSTYDFIETNKSTIKLSLPLPKEVLSIAQFIESLDDGISDSFRAVKLVDWMLAFELLETQSAEPMGFFVPKISLLSHEDDEAIQNIFFLLNNVRRQNSTSTLLESLPKCLRELCTLHMRLTNWFLSRIVEQKISIEQRSERLIVLLKSLSICRQRMSGMDLYESSDIAICRHVPSFVGSAIATALVRPESRMFNYAWQVAVKATGGSSSQIETLEQVIPSSVDGYSCTQPLTPCVGWMIERLLEIICHVPNMVVENNRLINFDKRRYVYNFVANFTNYPLQDYQNSTGLFSIPALEGIDGRSLRDTANKENQLSRHGRVKLFGRLLHQEQEKLRRDAKQRDAIERQQRQQLRAEHRRQPPGSKSDTVEKKSGKRLGVNSIFKAVRPISMALTGQWTPPQDTRRLIAPSELPPLKPLEYGRKPSTVIDLKSVSSISVPRGTLDRYIWRLTSDNGVGYWFQATSEKDLDYWLKCISDIRGVAASEGGESIDMLTVTSQNRVGQKVFGVSLEELCKRDNVQIPLVVESLLSEIESRGLGEVGIYRVPGSLASINALREALDTGVEVRMDDDRWYDINVVAGVFKLFMRELPDQAQGIGPETLLELRNLTAEIPDEDDRVPAYKEVILKLPCYNYHFLRRVYFHFAKISENQGANKMGAVNLAIVFGMGLSPSSSSPLGISPDLGLYQTMVKTWINFAATVFPEVTTDIEIDEDDEEDDLQSISVVTRTDSGDAPPAEYVSPALQKISNFSPRMSLEEFRNVVDHGPLIE